MICDAWSISLAGCEDIADFCCEHLAGQDTVVRLESPTVCLEQIVMLTARDFTQVEFACIFADVHRVDLREQSRELVRRLKAAWKRPADGKVEVAEAPVAKRAATLFD